MMYETTVLVTIRIHKQFECPLKKMRMLSLLMFEIRQIVYLQVPSPLRLRIVGSQY